MLTHGQGQIPLHQCRWWHDGFLEVNQDPVETGGGFSMPTFPPDTFSFPLMTIHWQQVGEGWQRSWNAGSLPRTGTSPGQCCNSACGGQCLGSASQPHSTSFWGTSYHITPIWDSISCVYKKLSLPRWSFPGLLLYYFTQGFVEEGWRQQHSAERKILCTQGSNFNHSAKSYSLDNWTVI